MLWTAPDKIHQVAAAYFIASVTAPDKIHSVIAVELFKFARFTIFLIIQWVVGIIGITENYIYVATTTDDIKAVAA